MRKGSHTQYDIQYHVVWTTKYRYEVLTGKIAQRLRILLMQGCSARGITIIRGNITKNHVHTNNSTNENGAISQRTKLKNITRRVSNIKKKILGATFLESRIFL